MLQGRRHPIGRSHSLKVNNLLSAFKQSIMLSSGNVVDLNLPVLAPGASVSSVSTELE
jgi:hypothetical protein